MFQSATVSLSNNSLEQLFFQRVERGDDYARGSDYSRGLYNMVVQQDDGGNKNN